MSKRKPFRPRRDRNPNNNLNWKLVCSICAAEFLDIENIDLVGGHWAEEHADFEDGTPHMNLVWVGVGPAPKRRK